MATSYNSTAVSGPFSIGNVLAQSFRSIGRNPVLLIGVPFVCGGLPQGLISFLQQGDQQQLRDYMMRLDSGSVSPAMIIGAVAVFLLIAIPLALISQGAMIRATLGAIQGEKASLGDCLAVAFSRMLPLLGLMILSGLAIGFAFLLLIVPGIILSLVWYVAAPVLVVEQLGVSESLSRSADLTRGYRWSLFGLAIIVGIIGFTANMLVGGMGAAFAAAAARAGDGSLTTTVAVLVGVFGAIGSTVSAVLSGVVPTALYVELRQAKEGPIGETLDHVFA